MGVLMKYLLLLVSFNAFAWNPTEIKIVNCKYGSDKDLEFTTSKSEFLFNRVSNNKQVKVFVKDTDRPSEIDDYMMISDLKGHKMTYFLKCKKMSK
jgi:hypothetical protein